MLSIQTHLFLNILAFINGLFLIFIGKELINKKVQSWGYLNLIIGIGVILVDFVFITNLIKGDFLSLNLHLLFELLGICAGILLTCSGCKVLQKIKTKRFRFLAKLNIFFGISYILVDGFLFMQNIGVFK